MHEDNTIIKRFVAALRAWPDISEVKWFHDPDDPDDWGDTVLFRPANLKALDRFAEVVGCMFCVEEAGPGTGAWFSFVAEPGSLEGLLPRIEQASSEEA